MLAGIRATTAGFILAGGQSSRMGRDKALLEIDGEPLAVRIGRLVRETAGSAAIIGDPGRYGHLGFPTIADRVAGIGPLGGLLTALESSRAEWSLVVACDMPGLNRALLEALVERAGRDGGVRCIAAESAEGPEPLCAIYHRASLEAVQRAVESGRLRMKDLLGELNPVTVRAMDAQAVANINTPDQWSAFQAAQDN